MVLVTVCIKSEIVFHLGGLPYYMRNEEMAADGQSAQAIAGALRDWSSSNRAWRTPHTPHMCTGYWTPTTARRSYRPAGRLDSRFETISFYRGLTMSLYEGGLFRPSWYQMYSLLLRQLEAPMTTAM